MEELHAKQTLAYALSFTLFTKTLNRRDVVQVSQRLAERSRQHRCCEHAERYAVPQHAVQRLDAIQMNRERLNFSL